MFYLSDEKMLPDIFGEMSELFEKVLTDCKTLNQSLSGDKSKVRSFFEYYSGYQTNGLLTLKSSLGDLCVGVRALGNKFGTIGGESFEKLQTVSNELIASTGDFVNFVNNFVVTSEQIMKEDKKNVKRYDELANKVETYFETLIKLFKGLADSTKFIYGDAKDRLKENFEGVEYQLVNFIHIAKTKIVASLASMLIGIKIGYDYFAGLCNIQVDNIYNEFLFDEEGVNNEAVRNLLEQIVKNFDDALYQAKKMFE